MTRSWIVHNGYLQAGELEEPTDAQSTRQKPQESKDQQCYPSLRPRLLETTWRTIGKVCSGRVKKRESNVLRGSMQQSRTHSRRAELASASASLFFQLLFHPSHHPVEQCYPCLGRISTSIHYPIFQSFLDILSLTHPLTIISIY